MSLKKHIVRGVLFTGFLSATAILTNKLINYLSLKDNLLKVRNDSFYRWRFGSVFYNKKGSGKPLLLIHDTNVTSSAYEWHRIVDELAKTNTVYSIDLLGCGRSDKPDFTYTNFLYVQMISDFIKNVIGEKADVIATGISGTFAIASITHDNSLIDKVIMVNPRDLVDLAKIPTKRNKTTRYLISVPILGNLLFNFLVNRRSIRENFERKYYYDADKVVGDDIKVYHEASQKDFANSRYLYASIISRYLNANIIHHLQKTTNSVFIIVGKENRFYEEAAYRYQEVMPAIEIVELDGCSYLPQLENPRTFTEQVKLLLEIY